MTERDLCARAAELVRLGVPLNAAASAVGFPRARFAEIMRIGQDDCLKGVKSLFGDCWLMMTEARGKAIGDNIARISKSAETDWHAAAYIIERMAPEDFSQASLNSSQQSDDGIMVISDVKDTSPDAMIEGPSAGKIGVGRADG